MTSVTALGWEIMITCEPSTFVIVAPARSAIERTTSVPAALSPTATTAHDRNFFQAGVPLGSVKASAAAGLWVAARTAVRWRGRSAANTSCNSPGSIRN